MNYETDPEARSCIQCFNPPKLDQERLRETTFICVSFGLFVSLTSSCVSLCCFTAHRSLCNAASLPYPSVTLTCCFISFCGHFCRVFFFLGGVTLFAAICSLSSTGAPLVSTSEPLKEGPGVKPGFRATGCGVCSPRVCQRAPAPVLTNTPG